MASTSLQRIVLRTTFVTTFITALGTAANAQPLDRFDALRLKPRQTVRVDTRSGVRFTGIIRDIQDTLLTITAKAGAQTVRVGDVVRVAVRRGHALSGALAVGGVMGSVVLFSECLGSGPHRECDFDIPIIIGGGLGALIGSVIHTWHTVYEDRSAGHSIGSSTPPTIPPGTM